MKGQSGKKEEQQEDPKNKTMKHQAVTDVLQGTDTWKKRRTGYWQSSLQVFKTQR